MKSAANSATGDYEYEDEYEYTEREGSGDPRKVLKQISLIRQRIKNLFGSKLIQAALSMNTKMSMSTVDHSDRKLH